MTNNKKKFLINSFIMRTFAFMDKKNEFMRRAIELSEESVSKGGGPFGAVIVRGDEIIAEASNSVTIDNDPTAHAEVNCIRKVTTKK